MTKTNSDELTPAAVAGQPWERRHDEDERHFAAFKHYRDSETRSHRDTATMAGVSVTAVKKWAAKFDWHNRLVELDRELDRELVEYMRRERRKLARKLFGLGMLMIDKGQAVIEKTAPTGTEDARRLIDSGVKIAQQSTAGTDAQIHEARAADDDRTIADTVAGTVEGISRFLKASAIIEDASRAELPRAD